jgi:tetratricopeptide (TPR) repeat protein
VQGFDYLDKEQWDQAIAEFEEAIRLDPQFGYAYMGLGYAYALGPRDLTKAIEHLESFLSLVPDAENRAQVEADMQMMREALANPPLIGPCCPAAQPGKGLLWVENFVGEPIQTDIGTNMGTTFYEIPAKQGDVSGCFCLEMDPGHYVLIVKTFTHSGNFEFDIAEGQITHFPLSYGD